MSGVGVSPTLFPDERIAAPHRLKARWELRHVCLELESEYQHEQALKRAAATHADLQLKISAVEVRIAALRARSAQLRRAAGRRDRAA